MTLDVLTDAQRLRAAGTPFALVSVLRVAPPASARPGDKAVVTAEGISTGWIGGGCAQPAVLRTVKQALADGRSRLIRIAPSEETTTPDLSRELQDVLEFGMACHSGGTLELFVDPVLPQARLVIVGDSPLAAALAGLAPRVGLPTTVLAHGADPARFAEAVQLLSHDDAARAAAEVAPGAFCVVATQGRRDLQGLRAALALQARQVFFVASARKAAVLKAALLEAGHEAQAVNAIVAPAGEPIGAQTPEEIALSVLAAVVAARRGAPVAARCGAPVSATHASLPAEAAAAPADRAPADALVATTACEVSAAAPLAPAPTGRPRPLPLPDLPPVKGSCCGS